MRSLRASFASPPPAPSLASVAIPTMTRSAPRHARGRVPRGAIEGGALDYARCKGVTAVAGSRVLHPRTKSRGGMMRMKVAAACALTLAIAACFGGVASAMSHAHAKAPIQEGVGDCGASHPQAKLIGTVVFKRVGNLVTLKVKMKHGEPNSEYQVKLYENGCNFLGNLFNFKTNTKGVGGGSGSLTVAPANTDFFANASDANTFTPNDTTHVTLP